MGPLPMMLLLFLPVFFSIPVAFAQFDSSGCGVTKACFLPLDQNCYMGCNGMKLSYKMLNESAMAIEIAGNSPTPTGFYFAVGFSYDDMMGNDSVIECSSLGDDPVSLKFSYNAQHNGDSQEPTNVRIQNQNSYSSYFQNAVATYSEGQVYCSAVVNVGGAADPMVFKYQPTVNYYLLMANGPTNSDGLRHHNHDVTSDYPVNLVDIRPPFDRNGCGVTKGCFIPTKRDCIPGNVDANMVFSYLLLNDTHMRIELQSSSPQATGHYVAVGFSKDGQMSNESVIECSSLGNAPLSTKFSYNADFKNVRIDGEENIRSQYISDQSDYQDGNLYCTAVVRITGDEQYPQIFKNDPNQAYYLLLAKGSTDENGLKIHDTSCRPMVSTKLSQLEPYFDPSTCGAEKNCFVPTVCYRGCNGMGFSYKMISNTSMKVELFSVATELGYYVALGFSYDDQMGNDSVIECSSINGKDYSMKFSYNVQNGEDLYNTRIKGEELARPMLISNQRISFADGRLYCSATIDVGGSAMNPEVVPLAFDGNPDLQIFKYNPDVNYWLLMASGTTSKTGLNKHFDHVVSDTAFNLETGEPVENHVDPNENFDCSQCGKTKGCYFPRGEEKCTGMGFAYQYISPTEIQMELMKDATSGYVAVGFSPNGKMGGVPVIECSLLKGGSLSMKFSYNDNSPNNVRISNEQSIEGTYFKDPTYTTTDGKMYCKAKVNVGGWSGSSRVFKYSSGQKYYLLLALGDTTATGLTIHSDKQASSSAVDLSAFDVVAGGASDTVKTRLKRAHAIMMILSWVCFVPTAMLFARFLRASWPLAKPGGLLIWFHVHRTCNLLGIVLMIASFVCIMCANDWQWSGPGSTSSKWSQIHTMTGLFALIFAWMQPFVSIMRCHPNTPNRPIFNWAHRTIGVVAFILATTALSVAAYHFDFLWPDVNVQLGLVLVPIAAIVILCIFIPILDFLQNKDQSNYPMLEMIRQVVVLVTVGLLTGDAIALCVMVGK